MKLLKRTIIFLFITTLIVLSGFMVVGYQGYKEVLEDAPLTQLVDEIVASETYVSFDDISDDLKDAIVAIEDHRFYEHGGLDYFSILRTSYYNIIANDIIGGGSSITQQLAKNLYFDYSQTYTRKISEAFMAYYIESMYSKDEILTLYLNVIYFGDLYYGVYDACMGYFNVLPSELTLYQASLLAGLPQAPSIYALSNNNELTYIRQIAVLDAMLERGYITQEEYDQVLEE